MGSLADREKRRSVVGSMVSEMPKTEVEYKNPTYKVRVDTFRKVKMKALEEGKHDYEIVQGKNPTRKKKEQFRQEI